MAVSGSDEAAAAEGVEDVEGVDPATVDALGKLSAALESVERARGHLYAFHQLSGKADFELGDAVQALRTAGHDGVAATLAEELVGRNVLEGRWSFQIVEEYDDTYWSAFRRLEQNARDRLAGGARHLYEAGLKEERRTAGRPHHEPHPPEVRDT